MSLRQVTELRKRYEASLSRRDAMCEVMGAQIIAMIANTGFRGFKEVMEPRMFMPSRSQGSAASGERPRQKRVSNAQRVAQLHATLMSQRER